MTNEEVIRTLTRLKDQINFEWTDSQKKMDALNVAIKTLSARPEIIHCGNCKHHSDEEPGMVYCPEIMGGWVNDECICAMWERKNGEQNG